MVKSFIYNVLEINLELKLNLYLLTIICSEMPSSLRFVLMHIIVTARIMYVQMWKSSQFPSEELLKQKLKTCIEMNRLTSVLHLESKENLKMKSSEVYRYLGMDINHII